MSLDRVSVNYIHDAKIFELHQDFYNLAYNSFGVNHLDLDSKEIFMKNVVNIHN